MSASRQKLMMLPTYPDSLMTAHFMREKVHICLESILLARTLVVVPTLTNNLSCQKHIKQLYLFIKLDQLPKGKVVNVQWILLKSQIWQVKSETRYLFNTSYSFDVIKCCETWRFWICDSVGKALNLVTWFCRGTVGGHYPTRAHKRILRWKITSCNKM